jgi:septal ring factor EnvC (AmiA/AmiB activator)
VEIKWEIILPFLIALPGAITSIILIASEIRRRQAETKDKEASVAERFINAADKLVSRSTQNFERLDKRISALENQVSSLTKDLTEAHAYLKSFLSLIDWLLSGIESLSAQSRALGQEPTFKLDDHRLEIMSQIREFVNGKNNPTNRKPGNNTPPKDIPT